ncbi:hypothetical protein G3I15_11590 [Streptomyces sp. SID10244]|nr:hypothetical protein [Streptomyces sp. SID10244]
MAADLIGKAKGQLQEAGRAVAARSFVGAFQTTLWALAAMCAAIAVLTLALGSRPGPNKPE